MRIAFLILAHADPVHLGRLSRTLQPAGDVYIHLDRKADLAVFREAVPSPAVFVGERHAVAWAGISMVDAIIALMREALDAGQPYTHFVLLTGSDYPIKPLSSLAALFADDPDKEHIRFIDMRESPEHYMKLITRRHFREPLFGDGRHVVDKVIRKAMTLARLPNAWPGSLVPYFGHTWCALTTACAAHVVDYHDSHPTFRAANRHTFAPDEHYFHTIVGNSPFAARATGLQPFEGRGLWRLANLHLIDPSLAKWYTLDDWDQIIRSDRFFVRKVRTESSQALLDRLDADVLTGHVA